MAKYRKIPVVIEAVKWTGENRDEIDAFFNDGYFGHHYNEDGVLMIKTLESGHGMHTATIGDYIIRGVEGEYYPCKPSVFEKTYEAGFVEEVEVPKGVYVPLDWKPKTWDDIFIKMFELLDKRQGIEKNE